MAGMMLTALDAVTGDVLNVLALSMEQRDRAHGARTARRNGLEIVCRGCGQPAHLVLNHRGTAFWRHGPNGARQCIVNQFHSNESPEHLAAKVNVYTALKAHDWDAKPEEFFGECQVDVYATHPRPAPHQTPMAWEVQLSRQTHGTFTERTERISRAAECAVNWLTPFDAELGTNQGIVTDERCRLVVGRLHAEPDEDSPRLEPMELSGFVKAVSAHRRTLLWAASGHGGRFIAFPVSWAGATTKRPSAPSAATEVAHSWDKACERESSTPSTSPPAEQTSLSLPDTRPTPPRVPADEWTRPIAPHTADECPRCGHPDSDRRFYGPCSECRAELNRLAKGARV